MQNQNDNIHDNRGNTEGSGLNPGGISLDQRTPSLLARLKCIVARSNFRHRERHWEYTVVADCNTFAKQYAPVSPLDQATVFAELIANHMSRCSGEGKERVWFAIGEVGLEDLYERGACELVFSGSLLPHPWRKFVSVLRAVSKRILETTAHNRQLQENEHVLGVTRYIDGMLEGDALVSDAALHAAVCATGLKSAYEYGRVLTAP